MKIHVTQRVVHEVNFNDEEVEGLTFKEILDLAHDKTELPEIWSSPLEIESIDMEIIE